MARGVHARDDDGEVSTGRLRARSDVPTDEADAAAEPPSSGRPDANKLVSFPPQPKPTPRPVRTGARPVPIAPSVAREAGSPPSSLPLGRARPSDLGDEVTAVEHPAFEAPPPPPDREAPWGARFDSGLPRGRGGAEAPKPPPLSSLRAARPDAARLPERKPLETKNPTSMRPTGGPDRAPPPAVSGSRAAPPKLVARPELKKPLEAGRMGPTSPARGPEPRIPRQGNDDALGDTSIAAVGELAGNEDPDATRAFDAAASVDPGELAGLIDDLQLAAIRARSSARGAPPNLPATPARRTPEVGVPSWLHAEPGEPKPSRAPRDASETTNARPKRSTLSAERPLERPMDRPMPGDKAKSLSAPFADERPRRVGTPAQEPKPKVLPTPIVDESRPARIRTPGLEAISPRAEKLELPKPSRTKTSDLEAIARSATLDAAPKPSRVKTPLGAMREDSPEPVRVKTPMGARDDTPLPEGAPPSAASGSRVVPPKLASQAPPPADGAPPSAASGSRVVPQKLASQAPPPAEDAPPKPAELASRPARLQPAGARPLRLETPPPEVLARRGAGALDEATRPELSRSLIIPRADDAYSGRAGEVAPNLLSELTPSSLDMPAAADVAVSFRLPSLARRVLASLIDAAVVIGLVAVPLGVGAFGDQLQHMSWLEPDDISAALASGALLLPAITAFVLVFAATTLSHGFAGRSLGKLALGLELVTIKEGARPSLFIASLRGVLTLLSLSLCGAGYFFVLLNRRERTLHDVLSGTVTVLAASRREVSSTRERVASPG